MPEDKIPGDRPIKVLFRDRLKYLMHKRDINQSELAKILGVSESTVGKWILLKAIPRMGVIQKLADYFDIGKSYFLEESASLTDYFSCDLSVHMPDTSMTGARVQQGDLVFLRQEEQLMNGAIMAVYLDDQLLIRRICCLEKQIILQAENPAYPPVLLALSEKTARLKVLGRAVAFQSLLK